MLARLDKIEGVAQSFANHSGTMIRLAVMPDADPETIAQETLSVLTEEADPVRITDEKLKQALENEQWRETARIGELSAIEFRTLVVRSVRAFAQTEKLDEASTARLLKIAEQEWNRMVSGVQARKADRSKWRAQWAQFARAVAEQAGSIITDEQIRRLKQTLGPPTTTRKGRPSR